MTDAAKLPLMLAELRMPTIGRLWQEMGERADREGWGAARFLAALCEHELAERATRRIARHLAEAGLPPGKTLYRVLFTRTTDLVQKLQAARRDLSLPATLAKLDKFDCLILDDLGYVRKDQAETTVLFELIAERYERRSLVITCNQPFGEWGQIFPDPAVTVAAIDRLVHHATILELNTESYRRRAAAAAGPGRATAR